MKAALLTLCSIVLVMISTANGQEREQPRARTGDQRQADFVPQNDRERALFEMIKQLRAEVASLRRQLQSREGDRIRLSAESGSRRDRPATVRREGDRPREGDRAHTADPRVASDPLLKKAMRIFAAYDKNEGKSVSFEEWLSMREGDMTDERKTRERGFFSDPAGDDDKITLEEFYRWMEKRSRGGAREDASGEKR